MHWRKCEIKFLEVRQNSNIYNSTFNDDTNILEVIGRSCRCFCSRTEAEPDPVDDIGPRDGVIDIESTMHKCDGSLDIYHLPEVVRIWLQIMYNMFF
jgi:hypothetical protein